MAFELERGSFDALVFDCDGTLVDSAPAHLYSMQQALAPLGLTMNPEWYSSRHGLGPDDLLDAYEADFKVESFVREDFYRAVNEVFLANLHLIEEIRVVTDVARHWFGVVPMAVASNGVRKNVEATLIATRLRPLFYTIVTAGEVKRAKPAPDVYLEAAHRMRVAPERVVVFEDSNEGLEAASRAGMRSFDIRDVWVPHRAAAR
ncbi:HAD family phosphatase [Edaphobacter sp. 12200R-103]|uniref:HAD family hydrolase n=1 Tax=Edaphobacter sp. 12200R-103 TaxID=2703788 RepID=UPI00138BB2EE|nr:HAD family phosphatase [Edaphobacter sp. 12200R-103]QHS51283.1 HAD family phosphatase [Edaphobacter sp. 12200R-103]